MIKTTAPTDFDFREEPTRWLKTAGGRIDSTSRDLTSAIHRRLEELVKSGEWHPDDWPLHNYALGQSETYGFNRNGDGFKKRACIDFHKTFEKHAYFFKNHKNQKEKDPHYGEVKFAYYNPEMGRIELLCSLYGTEKRAKEKGGLVDERALQKMAKGEPVPTSMACSSNPNTPVLTITGSKPLSKIKVGDLVYTHRGSWKKVTQLNRRPYTGKFVTIRAEHGVVLDLTADHPLLARRTSTDGTFDWMHAHHLKEGDFLARIPSGHMPFCEVVEVTEGYGEDVPTYNIEVEGDRSYSLAGIASHNCRIDYDECSACGNKARGRFEYCGPETCKAGGCRDNLGRIVELDGDLHHLGVDNPHPTWFDMSDVGRNADPISFGISLKGAEKSAAVSASGLIVPLRVWLDSSRDRTEREKLAMVCLHSLAEAEEKLSGKFAAPSFWSWADLGVRPELLPESRKQAVLADLAARRVVVPYSAYAELYGEKAAGRPCSFAEILKDDCPERFFVPLEKSAFSAVSSSDAAKLEAGWSLDPELLRRRAERSAMAGKSASFRTPGEATGLALRYAGYQASALAAMAEGGQVSPGSLRLTTHAINCSNATH